MKYTITPFDSFNDKLLLIGELYRPEGDGPFDCVIISHGFYDNLNTNKGISEELAANGYIVINFDFAGGSDDSLSEGNPLEMSVVTEVDDLKSIVDKALELPDIKDVYLLGFSQGGFVTAITAAELKDKIKKMVLFYPAFVIPDDTRSRFNSKEEIPEFFTIMKKPLGKKYSEDVYDMDAYEVIDGYDNPVLIIHGSDDSIVPIDYSKKALEVYPNAELKVIDSATHEFSQELRKELAKDVIDFLKKC